MLIKHIIVGTEAINFFILFKTLGENPGVIFIILVNIEDLLEVKKLNIDRHFLRI